MTLMGRSFKKGDTVPDNVMAEIPDGRLRSLKNTGMLRVIEFEEAKPAAEPQPEPQVEAQPEGDLCPECGAGPFKRLDRHMTTHEGD